MPITGVPVAETCDLGKKIFLLYPHSVIRDQMLSVMIFMGKRRDNSEVCIPLFDPSKLDPNNKISIYQFIKHSLQRYIDHLKTG